MAISRYGIALALVGVIGSAHAQTVVGRYQLVSGSYSFIGIDGIERQKQGLFKIDTATGEIFICSGSAFDGNAVGKPGKIVNRQTCTKFEQELEFDASLLPH